MITTDPLNFIGLLCLQLVDTLQVNFIFLYITKLVLFVILLNNLLHLLQFCFGFSVEAEVKMPSGKTDQPQIKDNHDGTVSVKYEPKQEGLHELSVKYNGHVSN